MYALDVSGLLTYPDPPDPTLMVPDEIADHIRAQAEAGDAESQELMPRLRKIET